MCEGERFSHSLWLSRVLLEGSSYFQAEELEKIFFKVVRLNVLLSAVPSRVSASSGDS